MEISGFAPETRIYAEAVRRDLTVYLASLDSLPKTKHLPKIRETNRQLYERIFRHVAFSKLLIPLDGTGIIFPGTTNVLQGRSGGHKSRFAGMLASLLLHKKSESTAFIGFNKATNGPRAILYVDTERKLTEQLPYVLQWLQMLAGYGEFEHDVRGFYFRSLIEFNRVECFELLSTGKIMLYNPETGRRVKYPYNHVDWAHGVLRKQNYRLAQCLFGLHQLKSVHADMPVAIVESEKTAILMAAFLPEFCWLATGGLHNLNARKCRTISGRRVVLYPDLGCLEKWRQKAEGFSKIKCKVSVSDLLEKAASGNDRKSGYDLADFLVQRDKNTGWALTNPGYPHFWDFSRKQCFTDPERPP